MNCCCESQFPLLGGLLGEVAGAVLAGSQVRVGFEYKETLDDPVKFQALIVDALLRSTAFARVKATITKGWLNDYVTIEGITNVWLGFPEDVGILVQGVLEESFPKLRINKRDPVVIERIPQEAVGDPNVAQTNAHLFTDKPDTKKEEDKGKGKDCWNTEKTWAGYLACELGVSTSSAMAYGAIGALVGVVVLMKALK